MVELGDRRPVVINRLVDLLNRQGEFNEAATYLDLAAEAVVQSESMSAQAIINSLGRKDVEGALKLAEQRAKAAPDDANSQANYGRVLAMNGEAELAEGQFSKAVALAPDDRGNVESAFRALSTHSTN